MFSLNGYSYIAGGQTVEKYNDSSNAWGHNPLRSLLLKLGIKSAKLDQNYWTTKANMSVSWGVPQLSANYKVAITVPTSNTSGSKSSP